MIEPSTENGTSIAARGLRGGIWVTAAAWWSLAVGFGATILLTRLLEPEVFGLFVLALFFTQLCQLHSKLGLRYAFGRQSECTENSLATFCLLGAGAAGAGILLTGLASFWLVRFGYPSVMGKVLLVLALGAGVDSLADTGSILLDRELRFGRTSLVYSLSFTLAYLPALWLAYRGAGIWSLVAQHMFFTGFRFLGIFGLVHGRLHDWTKFPSRFTPGLAREYLRFGGIIGLGLAAGIILAQFDNFLIGTLVGVSALGFYDRAYRMAQWPGQLLQSLTNRALFYTYARLREHRSHLHQLATFMLWIIANFSLPLALAVFLAAPELVMVLYGPRWLPSVFFLRILALLAAVQPLLENAGQLFIALGKPRLFLQTFAVPAGVLIVGGPPLTLAWGATGTCLAVGLAGAIGTVMVFHRIRLETGISPWAIGASALPPLILTLAGYLALKSLVDLQQWNLVIRLAVKAFFVFTIYWGWLGLARPRLTRENLEYFRQGVK